jgi:hypothetical protein
MHPALAALYDAQRRAETLEQHIAIEDFYPDTDRFVNVVVMILAVHECPSGFRERPYAYVVIDDGAGPRVAITGDNGTPQLIRYMNERRLPLKMWLRHYETDHGGYRRYWNKALESAMPGEVITVRGRKSRGKLGPFVVWYYHM